MTKLFKIALTAFAAMTMAVSAQEIQRNDEGTNFYSTIEVPANADQLFVSGKGPRAVNPDAPRAERTYGDTGTQARSTFNSIKAAVEKAGWSMSDIVMVRVYLVADLKWAKWTLLASIKHTKNSLVQKKTQISQFVLLLKFPALLYQDGLLKSMYVAQECQLCKKFDSNILFA